MVKVSLQVVTHVQEMVGDESFIGEQEAGIYSAGICAWFSGSQRISAFLLQMHRLLQSRIGIDPLVERSGGGDKLANEESGGFGEGRERIEVG